MADRWRPGRVLVREAQLLQRRVADAIARAEPPARGEGKPGGSLSAAARSAAILVVKPWGCVVQWSELGQKLLWFVRGTQHQKARPVVLIPDEARIRAAVEEDAAKHYAERERRAARGLR